MTNHHRKQAEKLIKEALAAELHCGTEDCDNLDDWEKVIELTAVGLFALGPIGEQMV